MRKINLRGITESLSEREMKMVKGGEPLNFQIDPGPMPAIDGGLCGQLGGTCGWQKVVNGITWYDCGVSKAEAISQVSGGGRWCCDSCDSNCCVP